MLLLIKIFLWFIGLSIIVSVIWRICSRYLILPCPAWLAWMVERDNPFSRINRAATIISHLDLKPGMKVLDVGCGPGRVTIPAAKKVGPNGQVTAIDIQAEMLRKIQAKAQKESLANIIYIHGGIGQKKLPTNAFDRALLITVLGEIPDSHRQSALKEIFDALKPGGILSVTEIILDPHFQRQSAVINLACSVGFKEKMMYGNWLSYTLIFEKLA